MAEEAEDLAHRVGQYLTQGAPYRGVIPYVGPPAVHAARKEAVKECGAKWCPNPEFVEGVRGRGGPVRGWWTASHARILVELLELKRLESFPAGGKTLWQPLGLCERGAALLHKRCVDEKQRQDAQEEHERTKRKPTAEQQEREERTRLGIPEDYAEDVAALQALGIEYSRALVQRIRRVVWPSSGLSLGPRSGISDAARLLRGVRLNILIAQEISCYDGGSGSGAVPGAGAGEDSIKRPRRSDVKRKRQFTPAAVATDSKEARDGTSDTSEVPDVPEPTTPSLLAEQVCSPFLQEASPCVRCDKCGDPVWIQFMECACPYSKWGIGPNGALSMIV
jgi:hypothetical protein